MKSFPSTANESEAMYGSCKANKYAETFDIERIKALNLNTSVPVIQEQLKENNINASNFQRYFPMHRIKSQDILTDDQSDYAQLEKKIFYENPLQMPAETIALAKDYEWIYKYQVNSLASYGEKSGKSLQATIVSTSVVPSMFNPMYGVNALGITRNTPLLNDAVGDGDQYAYDLDIDDCSIRTLCSLSKNPNSSMGQARYKYADFMYCKDLGKVSNNHLITLRKFAHPIGDHIFKGATPKYIVDGEPWNWEIEGDIGRLVSWFGTDDNKLEDIAKFSYHASWRNLEAKIEQQESKTDDSKSGIIGMLSNSLNPTYNKAVGAGQAGGHSIISWLGAKITPGVMQGIGSNNMLLSNYDNNKVYEPKNTMRSNHIYEGNLIFNHEFTLNFSYELRAYENINPRSALLDLLGNILEVTYRRGKFWGGARKVIGPTQDTSMFDKVSKFVDGAYEEIPGFLASFKNGGINFSKVLGKITNFGSEVLKGAQDAAKNVINGGGKQAAEYIGKLYTESGAADAIKGLIKNGLGRPQLYAWQSLVSGDDVGLWHVTVGNPRNPILAIGNLILENAEIQQSGPLGVDDFPTQLKVSVTLKHARPRDITDISRMYTSGTNAIYHHFAAHRIADFFPDGGIASDSEHEDVPQQKPGFDKLPASERNKLVKQSTQKEANDELNYTPSLNSNFYRDPYLYNSTEISMMRKNTWSNTMFYMMMQEAA